MKDHELTFDGAKLHFPRYISTSALKQARRNAARLGRELSSALGELVQVKAILAFPGWYLNRTGTSDVSVVNPKEIRQVVFSKTGPQLAPEQIWRIAQQIEQKCRDVAL
jgi:predicted RNA binding protein YcfA (HicA-like mRNA interferase family)